jgi:hypothetical protein
MDFGTNLISINAARLVGRSPEVDACVIFSNGGVNPVTTTYVWK